MYNKLGGKFISFEGTEGCGKTTLIKKVAQTLNDNSVPVVARYVFFV